MPVLLKKNSILFRYSFYLYFYVFIRFIYSVIFLFQFLNIYICN